MPKSKQPEELLQLNTAQNTDKYITISKASEILGVSIDTIRRWDKAGRLTAYRFDNKNRYFDV